jgi:PadR family transcriptional regulator PadR
MWAPGQHLGEFQQLVLLTVINLGDNAWSGAIRQSVETLRARSISASAVYETLKRLQDKGLVDVHLGPRRTDGRGRRRHMYNVTAAGSDHIIRLRSAFGEVSENGTSNQPSAPAARDSAISEGTIA